MAKSEDTRVDLQNQLKNLKKQQNNIIQQKELSDKEITRLKAELEAA